MLFRSRVAFDFGEPEEPQKTEIACPKCQKNLMRETWNYTCSCGYKVSRKVAGRELTIENVKELLEKGSLQNLEGFISKAGKSFTAGLKIDENGAVKFDFQ